MATSYQSLRTTAGDVQAGLLQGENIQLQEVGVSAVVDNYMYSKANFYIEGSRAYVGKQKLTRYFFIKWLHWLYVPIFIGSFFTPFNFIASFVLFGVNLLVFINYFQHMYVNITTMWYVLKQPSLPDNMLKRNNMIYELTLERFVAIYASSHRAGFGRVVANKGTIQFQVFRRSAIRVMKNCVITSTLCFLCSLFMFVYCYVWGIVIVLQGSYKLV